MHCVQGDRCDELLTAAIFSNYEKAICIYPKTLVECDLSQVYGEDLEGKLICAKAADNCKMQVLFEGAYSHLFRDIELFDMGISVINVKQWNKTDMTAQMSISG